MFETGGTAGMPQRRIGWDDCETDYEEFWARLRRRCFPRGSRWLMLGPTGPRQLRLAIEQLANVRGGSCFFVDLDPRFGSRRSSPTSSTTRPRRTWSTVSTRARPVPRAPQDRLPVHDAKLLEAWGEKINVADAGVKDVFSGGAAA